VIGEDRKEHEFKGSLGLIEEVSRKLHICINAWHECGHDYILVFGLFLSLVYLDSLFLC
jgi:hypothetical protein